MAAYRVVYDSRHLQADCQEPGSALEPYTLGNRVWATFTFTFIGTYPTYLPVVVVVYNGSKWRLSSLFMAYSS